jgi:hypothetical protein
MEQYNEILSTIGEAINSRIINAILVIIFVLIIKDFLSAIATNFVDSLFYIFDSNFKAGQCIILEDENVQIIKIGLINTIVEDDKGNWRYIMNSRLKYMKIEKEFSTYKKRRKNKNADSTN